MGWVRAREGRALLCIGRLRSANSWGRFIAPKNSAADLWTTEKKLNSFYNTSRHK